MGTDFKPTESPEMRWQYKIETGSDEDEVNALGADGWELFHAHWEPVGPLPEGYGRCGDGPPITGYLRMLFRRQLEQ